jgi:hypothetical protein
MIQIDHPVNIPGSRAPWVSGELDHQGMLGMLTQSFARENWQLESHLVYNFCAGQTPFSHS